MPSVFDNPDAFGPFFDETIVVEGKRPASRAAGASRPVKGTFRACVFDNGFADPFAEGDADSNVRTFSVSVRPGDWIEGTPPQPGDRITLERDGFSFHLAVKDVTPTFGSWTVAAREVKNG